MGKVKGYLGKVALRAGLIIDKATGGSFSLLTQAWKKEADCGCGQDCCEREFVQTDKLDEKQFMYTYFEGGEMFVRNGLTGEVFKVTLTLEP